MFIIQLLHQSKIVICSCAIVFVLLIHSLTFASSKIPAKNVKPKIVYNTKNCTKITITKQKRTKVVWKVTSRFLREIDTEDLRLLEQVVENEAGGEPYLGKIAVANVILNRVRSSLFPNTIRGVIFQKGQFAKLDRALKLTPSEETKKAVQEALNGKQVVPQDVFYFLNLNIAKDLSIPQTKTFVTKIGNHWFYK